MTLRLEHMDQELDKVFYKAENHFFQGEIPEAAELLRSLLSDFPESGKVNWLMALIYHRHYKDLDKADSHYRSAIRFSPENSVAYLDYADLLSTQERSSELIALLNKAMELPGTGKDRIQELFGLLKEKQQKFDEAIAHYRDGIMNCFDTERIVELEGAIKRCQIKKKY
ncbi:MAG: tetratricopeptide repeat protein [Bacteroidia bacterium]|nr:tetratricopeptide repeat protein [Bacteroidia bacterium]